jgi:uncharacterized protein with ATP-grasp and redox domains
VEALNPFPQCVECLTSLAQGSAKLAAGDNPRLKAEARSVAIDIFEHAKDAGLNSPEVGNRILRKIKQLSGSVDPYTRVKDQEMALAKEVFSRIEDHIRPDLRSRISLAVLGNCLDFFKDSEEVLSEIPDQIERGLSFFYDDVDRLEYFLSKNPELVLYLTDNSGEIYFDLPLYEYIKERSRRCVLVVKGGASLNDLTRRELQLAGLEDRFDEVADTGTDGVGIDWDRVSTEFLNLINSADLIISKGMANFETVYPREMAAPRFFLLKVKCRPVQDYVRAPMDSHLALWWDGIRRKKRETNGSAPVADNHTSAQI